MGITGSNKYHVSTHFHPTLSGPSLSPFSIPLEQHQPTPHRPQSLVFSAPVSTSPPRHIARPFSWESFCPGRDLDAVPEPPGLVNCFFSCALPPLLLRFFPSPFFILYLNLVPPSLHHHHDLHQHHHHPDTHSINSYSLTLTHYLTTLDSSVSSLPGACCVLVSSQQERTPQLTSPHHHSSLSPPTSSYQASSLTSRTHLPHLPHQHQHQHQHTGIFL
jgi:hypothetical protein